MFDIVTDSCADLPREIFKKYNIKIASLMCVIEGISKKCFSENENDGIDLKELYDKMRKRADISTSLAPPEEFERIFIENAKNGVDTLCITIGSTLSGTNQSAKIARDIVLMKFPEANIKIVDTLNGSLGEGLLCLEAAQKRESGESFEDTFEFCEKEKHNICSWFTFDDLYYLKKGGRVSSASAFLGGMLGIKPLMNVTKYGVIVPNAKLRGRKAAIEALINGFGNLYDKNTNVPVGIAHADCNSEVEEIKNELKKRFGIKEFIVEYLDPVIGAHGGPGTVGIFFRGKKE